MSRCPNCGHEVTQLDLSDLSAAVPVRAKARRSDPAPSVLAARQAFPKQGKQRHQVLMAVYRHGGLTADAAARFTGLPYVSVSTRISKLKAGGWLEPRNRRSTSSGGIADVLVITAAAREEIEKQRSAVLAA